MKTILSIVFAAMALAACGRSEQPCPTCPDCPPSVDCPTPTPCPDCPPQQPCPEPPPCPDCPPCDPNVICPKPPEQPVYEDQQSSAGNFEFTVVLAAPETLGLYVADPNGQFNSAVFSIPQLAQKWGFFQEVVVLHTQADESGDQEIGYIKIADEPEGLVIAKLCADEYADQCVATVTTNGPNITKFTINLLALDVPGNPFTWESK